MTHTPGPWKNHYGLIVNESQAAPVICSMFGKDEHDFHNSPANSRLITAAPDMLDELMNYCAECNGAGGERCPYYNKDGDMCRMAQDGTCDTWMVICKATGHDTTMPWEVTK